MASRKNLYIHSNYAKATMNTHIEHMVESGVGKAEARMVAISTLASSMVEALDAGYISPEEMEAEEEGLVAMLREAALAYARPIVVEEVVQVVRGFRSMDFPDIDMEASFFGQFLVEKSASTGRW